MKFSRTLFAALSILALSAHAQVATPTNLLFNGDFGANGATAYSYCYMNGSDCEAPGWTGVQPSEGGGAVVIGTYSSAWGWPGYLDDSLLNPYQSTGVFVAGLQSKGSLSQTVTLGAGSYKLSWMDGNRNNYGVDQSYAVSFNGLQLGNAFDTNKQTGWQAREVSFTLAAGATGALTFQGLNAKDATAFIDNVSLVQTSAVPEPESYALALAGLAVVGQIARRRRA